MVIYLINQSFQYKSHLLISWVNSTPIFYPYIIFICNLCVIYSKRKQLWNYSDRNIYRPDLSISPLLPRTKRKQAVYIKIDKKWSWKIPSIPSEYFLRKECIFVYLLTARSSQPRRTVTYRWIVRQFFTVHYTVFHTLHTTMYYLVKLSICKSGYSKVLNRNV